MSSVGEEPPPAGSSQAETSETPKKTPDDAADLLDNMPSLSAGDDVVTPMDQDEPVVTNDKASEEVASEDQPKEGKEDNPTSDTGLTAENTETNVVTDSVDDSMGDKSDSREVPVEMDALADTDKDQDSPEVDALADSMDKDHDIEALESQDNIDALADGIVHDEETNDAASTSTDKSNSSKPYGTLRVKDFFKTMSTSDPTENGLGTSNGADNETITADKSAVNNSSAGDDDVIVIDEDESPEGGNDEAPSSPKPVLTVVNKITVQLTSSGPASPPQITTLPKPVIADCLNCGSKKLNCSLLVILSNQKWYICSDKCRAEHEELYNSVRRTVPSNININRDRYPAPCPQCRKTILSNTSCMMWEGMSFCKEECLEAHMFSVGTCCILCKYNVTPASLGKYCVRFGDTLSQFCSLNCLGIYKRAIKTCSLCQKNLQKVDTVYTCQQENGGRDYCSEDCFRKYEMISEIDNTVTKLGVNECAVCHCYKVVQYELIVGDIVYLCSDACLAAYNFVNSVVAGLCHTCRRFYDKKHLSEIVLDNEDGSVTSYCSLPCMIVNTHRNRKTVPCVWCKAKKYNFDMIGAREPGGGRSVLFFCSLNCRHQHQGSTGNKSLCFVCKKLVSPIWHITMSDSTVRSYCSNECIALDKDSANSAGTSAAVQNVCIPVAGSTDESATSISSIPVLKKVDGPPPGIIKLPVKSYSGVGRVQFITKPRDWVEMHNKMTQCRVRTVSKAVTCAPVESQSNGNPTTENSENNVLVPVPVPMYVPTPLAMYSLPYPVLIPVPIPVPVPIFIPTTADTSDKILDELKKIQEKTPSSLIEAELLRMAELVSDPTEETTEDPCGSFEDNDVLQMALNIAHMDSETSQNSTKRKMSSTDEDHIPNKRKATNDKNLGIRAFKFFINAYNDGIEKDEDGADAVIPTIPTMTPSQLNDALVLFVQKGENEWGTKYPIDYTHHFLYGIQSYLLNEGRDEKIFYDEAFSTFNQVLFDDTKKSLGEVTLTMSHLVEDDVWQSEMFGSLSPQILLTTIMYNNAKYCNLKTAEEHMRISFSDFFLDGSVIKFTTPQSILDNDPSRNKSYELTKNKEDRWRCPVTLYKFYLSKCPSSVMASDGQLYLSPIPSCTSADPVWYKENSPVSYDFVEKLLNRLLVIRELHES